MPEPLPDVNREHDCYHYQAPSGQRCGSPALKGEYYCYHHHIKHAKRAQNRVLIDPEVTRMEIPVIEDRASIFLALAAVIHRLAENTIDTRRAGQMIYGLQVAMRALEPPRVQRAPAANPITKPGAPEPALSVSKGSSPLHRDDPGATPASPNPGPVAPAPHSEHPAVEPATDNLQPATRSNPQPATPTTIPITKESLLYFLRSRHCASCNAELFPAEELTERPNPGAPPEVIEESRPALPAPQPATEDLQPATVLPTLHAVAENPPRGVVPRNTRNPGSFLPPIILSNRSMIGVTLRLDSRLTNSCLEAER
jgi:hypothetical protein